MRLNKELIIVSAVAAIGFFWLRSRKALAEDNRTDVEKLVDNASGAYDNLKKAGSTFADIWNHLLGQNPTAPVNNPAKENTFGSGYQTINGVTVLSAK